MGESESVQQRRLRIDHRDARYWRMCAVKTSIMLSFRIPPLCDPDHGALKQVLEANPPYGAKVCFTPKKGVFGWNAPKVQPWLADALNQASQNYYGKPMLSWGEGATIPFIYMLGEHFLNVSIFDYRGFRSAFQCAWTQ